MGPQTRAHGETLCRSELGAIPGEGETSPKSAAGPRRPGVVKSLTDDARGRGPAALGALRSQAGHRGLAVTSADFRAPQVLSAAAGAAAAAVLALSLTVTGRIPVITGVALVIAGGMAGFLLRGQFLSLRVRRRREAILSEFPSVAELFALSVGAGESAAGALERIAATARGELAGEFRLTLADMRAGASLSAALKAMGRRVQLAPVERFIGGVLIALDRGTPLADVLRAQAQDVREMGRRELMEAAGRKEIHMMVPIVTI